MTLLRAVRRPTRAFSRHLSVVLTLVLAGYSAAPVANPSTAMKAASLAAMRETPAAGGPPGAPNVTPHSPTLAEATYVDPPPSAEVTNLTKWIIASRDNGGMPFLIIDKANASVFVFDATGDVQAAAPALLGLTRGDREAKGVDHKRVLAIGPRERITPAGRFVASLGREPDGTGLLWIDYKDAIALHPVVKGTPREHRAERLASPTFADNRISYGCINVPVKFYKRFVERAFMHTSGIVYILPETKSGKRLFWSELIKHGAALPARLQP